MLSVDTGSRQSASVGPIVLLFSFFANTVEYVRNFLRAEVERKPALSSYRGRVIAVTRDDDLEEISRRDANYGFAPCRHTGVDA